MKKIQLIVDSYFDGHLLQNAGPYTFLIEDGIIASIAVGKAPLASPQVQLLQAPFAMPGLCEAHCHLFLNGAELDVKKRKDSLSAPREQMLQVARQSLTENFNAGITLIRDAGDIHGINIAIREELAHEQAIHPQLRCPGYAMRKAKRYGSFMAIETTDDPQNIQAVVKQLAQNADDLKILLTGIIDFEKGIMKGNVQFDLAQAKLIVAEAQKYNLLTYAHCSGADGLKILTEAGIHSIEHGFFMEKKFLEVMAQKQIAWVPTFSPVFFQYARPEFAGWNQTTIDKLWDILDNHFKHLDMAQNMGVPIVAGSDAGSYGVPHGTGLIDEMLFHAQAGLSVDAVLASATSTPRQLWGCNSADLKVGNRADLITLEESPYKNIQNLKKVQTVVLGQTIHESVCANIES